MLAKVFENGRSQAVRIPKEYRVDGDEVIINKVGKVLLIAPKNVGWDLFFDALDDFSEDYMAAGRVSEETEERETL